MKYFLGTDEAGYGPNLGPLVVTATLWRVAKCDGSPLYERLRKVVTAQPDGADDARVWLADSKKVHGASDGLRRLELGALAALRACGIAADELRRLLALVDGEARDGRSEPWHAVDVPLPTACERSQLEDHAAQFEAGLREAGVSLVGVRCRCLYPAEFNDGCDQFGNKATLLTATTLRLVRNLLDCVESGEVEVACDKHGGRNSYAAALQEHLTGNLVQTIRESRTESSYCFREAKRRVRIGFHVGGESHLPTALASMISKFVREAAMRGWNEYWGKLVPDLRPTAGYAVDSRRFRKEIEAVAAAQKLDEREWWRVR
jgi:ribonuclease HII